MNAFVSSCDSVSRTLHDFGNSEHNCAFLSEIDQKITDHAFHSSYETYDVEWETTKNHLLQHYAYLQKSSDVMVASIENLRQGKDEDLIKYAERARALLHDLNAAYKPLTPQLKTENDRRVARYFVRGASNGEIKRLIPLGVISNLDDSIAQVLNLEATMGSNVSARDLFCQTCRAVGHRESSCNLRNRDTNELLASLLIRMGTGRNNGPVNRNIPYNNNRNRFPTGVSYNTSNNNVDQTQHRGNYSNYAQHTNNNNNYQAQNRTNYMPQTQYQQQNPNRNRPIGPNNNVRMVNVEENGEHIDQGGQEVFPEHSDNPFMDFPEQSGQINYFEEADSGNYE